MENKKTYTRERPESWKYFHAPYNIVVYGLSFVLFMVGTIGWMAGYMVSIALVAISKTRRIIRSNTSSGSDLSLLQQNGTRQEEKTEPLSLSKM